MAYALTLGPPLRQHFGLANQIRRAAVSVPANIAEGYGLGPRPQFIKGLRIALGSSMELASHLMIVRDLRLAPEADVQTTRRQCDVVLSLLIGLLRSLNAKPPKPRH